jgi:heat shock protein 4
MEDEDLRQNLKRDDLEELVAPFIVEFKKCLEESLTVTGVDITTIDSVELVGEATRIPCCIQQIKDVFKMDPSRTLNSTDCIARGCALQAAMLSPNFQTAAYEMEEYNSQPVCITYKPKGADAAKTNVIFKTGSNFPSTKSVTFDNKTGGYDLMIHYADDAQLLEGHPKQIAQYDIADGTKQEKTEKCSFTMRVTNNIHNVACLDEAELVEEWTHEDKIPIKTKNDKPPTVTPPPEDKKEGEAEKEGEKKEEAPAEEKPAEPEE